MNHDDTPQRRLSGRREALRGLGGVGLALMLPATRGHAQARPACIARPRQTEGPYFVDTGLARSDIRSDPVTGVVEAGMPLHLSLSVSRLDSTECRPWRDAHVELWQCNARGVYSGVRDPGFDARGRKFLRGYQLTDAAGLARFTTIYPGWYPGRTVHLHFMVRTARPGGGGDEFASQLYFDDRLSDEVFAAAPYADRGPRTVRNDADGIYRRGGAQLMVAVRRQGAALAGSFDIALHAER